MNGAIKKRKKLQKKRNIIMIKALTNLTDDDLELWRMAGHRDVANAVGVVAGLKQMRTTEAVKAEAQGGGCCGF